MTASGRQQLNTLLSEINATSPYPCEYYTEPNDGELQYCTHPENKVDEEGNCRSSICPVGNKDDS